LCRTVNPEINWSGALAFVTINKITIFAFLLGNSILYKTIISMYAIVNIAGKQFKVTQDQFVYAPKMEGEDGASVEFDKVLLVDNDGKVEVGAPLVKGAKVSGKILGHVKGDKVVVFKKKRRKGYKKRNGHRQDFTKVLIEKISK
jgi:large subunit ribosomal protein L21